MTAGLRLRCTLSTLWALLGALFAWVPFLPRLARAAFTGGRDRQRILDQIRGDLERIPREPPATPPRGATVFIVAGEPSGDLHAADLAAALRRIDPTGRLVGIGGPRMAEAGVELTEDLVSEPVMGVWPVLCRIGGFFRLYRDVLIRFESDPPDVFVGVDYPGLNLRLVREARKRGIPAVVYIAPQVWAWAPWRAESLARVATRILTILPFEPAVFERAGAVVEYVGHPLLGHLAKQTVDEELRGSLRADLEPGCALVALLPGSRGSEVAANLPLLLDAAGHVAAARPGTRFVVAAASDRVLPLIRETLSRHGGAFAVAVTPPGRGDDAMAAADAAVTVSGTATLHLVAHATPAVVVYHASGAGRWLARLLLVSPFIALPNLLAGERVLPEFLAAAGDGPRIADALLPLLPGGDGRDAALAALAALRARLDLPAVPDRAARWVLAATDSGSPRARG